MLRVASWRRNENALETCGNMLNLTSNHRNLGKHFNDE